MGSHDNTGNRQFSSWKLRMERLFEKEEPEPIQYISAAPNDLDLLTPEYLTGQ